MQFVDNGPCANYSFTYLYQTHIFEWHVVWCGPKTCTRDNFMKEIGLSAQNSLGRRINIIGGGEASNGQESSL